MKHFFNFTMLLPLKPQAKFLIGMLDLVVVKDKLHSFIATSGAIGWQFQGSWDKIRRGVIPLNKVANLPSYYVSTNRLWLPNVKGVEGSFFPIEPFTVKVNGVERGDFGVHFDANYPGSRGCIVLPDQADWTMFLEVMKNFAAERVKSIPLYVHYPLKVS